MAATLGFGNLINQGQQTQQQGNQPQQNQQLGSQQNQQGQPTNVPQAGQQGTAAGSTSSAVGSNTPAGAGAQYKPAAYSQQTQGTGYTNIQQYLGANAPSQFQQNVAQNIGSQNQAVLGGIQGAQQQFQQQTQANQANTQANQQLIQNVLANPTQYANTSGNYANQVGTNAGTASATASQTATPQNLQQGSLFSQLIGGQYQGPTGIDTSGQLSAQANAAAQQAQNLTTAGGRASILQNLIANPQYTQGQQSLDALLLGQGNSQALQQARAQALQLQNLYGTTAAGAQAQGQEQANVAQQFGAQTQQQLANTVQGIQSNLQNQAAQAQQQNTASYQQLLNDLQSGRVTQQEAQQFGLTQGENVYNVLSNPSTFVNRNPLQATAQNVATPQQYAQIQALQQLSGSAAPTAATSVFQNFANPQQAGTFANAPAYSVNQPAFANALANTQANVNSILQPAQQQVQQATQINNWVNRNVTPADIQFAKSMGITQLNGIPIDQAYAQAGGAVGQALINALYPGASYNGLTRTNWAAGNLAAAQQAMTAAQQNIQSQYGTPTTIQIQGQPSQTGLGRLIRPQASS